MHLTQLEQEVIRLYRELKAHGYGTLTVRVAEHRGQHASVDHSYKLEKLNDAED